jgi:hypothetical protein
VQGDVAQLLSALLVDGADHTAWAQALTAHCGGHPLTTLQVLQALHDAQGLASRLPPAELPLPRAALERTARLLDGVEEVTERLAFIAAVAGSDFDEALARRMLRRRPSALLVPWRRLKSLAIFDDRGFSHELVRRAVLDRMPAALAAALHSAHCPCAACAPLACRVEVARGRTRPAGRC